MRVHDADFRTHVVNIRMAFSHTSLSTPKSGEERPVPMAGPLKAILAESYGFLGLSSGRSDSNPRRPDPGNNPSTGVTQAVQP
jgi:hypothetical protein